MPVTGYLLLNRLLWLGAGVAVLAWTVLGFDPQPRSQKSGRDSGEPEAGEALRAPPTAARMLSAAAAWQQFVSRLFLEVRSVLRTVPFWVMLAFAFLSAYMTSTLVDPVFGSLLLSLTRCSSMRWTSLSSSRSWW